MSAIQSIRSDVDRITGPIPVSREQAVGARDYLARYAPDLLEIVAPLSTVYPPTRAADRRRATPRQDLT